MKLLEPREHFDHCITGLNHENTKAIYDIDKVIEKIMYLQEIDYDDAVDWFGYNTISAFDPTDEEAPIFMYTDFILE